MNAKWRERWRHLMRGKQRYRSEGGDPNVTWEDTAKHIGEDYSGGIIMVADERVDKVMLSRYCEPAEIGNLTYWDEEVARMAGYRSQVVPWAAVKEVPTYSGNWRPGQPTRFPLDADVDFQSQLAARAPSTGDPPMPPTNAGFFTDMTIEFFEPVCLGDRVTTLGRILSHVTPKETRVGVGAFIGVHHQLLQPERRARRQGDPRLLPIHPQG